MDKTKKVPPTRVPITRKNVSLGTLPPAPKCPTRTARTPPRSPSQVVTRPPVSIMAMRPNAQRIQNEYVRTPLPGTARPVQNVRQSTSPKPPPVLVQPEPLKDQSSDPEEVCTQSIFCPVCGRCKCRACTTPRELPKKWMCGNHECSAQKAVEVATCMCAVKFMFETCAIQDREHEMALTDNPCACCSEPHCCKRWTCMGLMSFCLPCLCLYPFLTCGLMLCTSCYNRATRHGCQCRANKLPGSKRLLIDSENSSST